MPDPARVKVILDRLQTSDRVRAAAWDAFAETDPDAFRQRLDALPLGETVKGQLWDARVGMARTASPVTRKPTSDSPLSLLRGVAERVLPFTNFDEAKAFASLVASGPNLPRQMGEAIGKNVVTRVGQARQSLSQGHLGDALYNMAAAVPIAGPMMDETVQAYQGGEPWRAAGQVIGTVAPGALLRSARLATNVGRNISRAARLRTEAKQAVIQALDPRKEKWKAEAARIAEDVARRKVGGSLKDVHDVASEAVETTGKKIGEFWDTRQDTLLPTDRMVGEIERSKQPYQNVVIAPEAQRKFDALKAADPTLDDAAAVQQMLASGDLAPGMVKVIPTDPRVVKHLSELQDLIIEHGETISAKNARKLLHTWREPVAATGGYSQKTAGSVFQPDLAAATELWAKREGADAISQVLSGAHPDIVDLNKEFTFQRRLRDISGATLGRISSHRSTGLGARVAAAGAGPAGAVVGSAVAGVPGAAIGAVVGAEAARRLVRVFDGPRWKLFDARRKMALADAIASGNPGRIRSVVGKTIAFDQSLQASQAR